MSLSERAVIDLISGGVAGILSTAVVHPLDTIRTRLQSTNLYAGAWDCARQTIRHEGIFALYQGLSAPLVAQAFYKAIIFTVNTAVITLWKGDPKAKLSPGEMALCGGIAGATNSFVVTPVELLRNRLMVQRHNIQDSKQKGSLGKMFNGPLHCARDVIKRNGILGLWQGNLATVIRDGFGVAAWFLAFNYMRMAFSGNNAEPLPFYKLVAAGSVAGVAFWAVALPADTVKSVIQVSVSNNQSLWANITQLLKQGGPSRLFRGWGVAVVRGIPGSGIALATHYSISNFLINNGWTSNKTF